MHPSSMRSKIILPASWQGYLMFVVYMTCIQSMHTFALRRCHIPICQIIVVGDRLFANACIRCTYLKVLLWIVNRVNYGFHVNSLINISSGVIN